jgi:iron(III) transport system permease protein
MYSYLPLGLYGTIWILVVAYGARFISHSVRLGVASFMRVGRDLDEAARIAGASLLRRFVSIHLPMLKEAFRASAVLLLIYSIIEVSSTIVLYTPETTTISVFMWRGMQMTGTVQVFAVAVAQSVFIGLLLIVSMRWLESSADK